MKIGKAARFLGVDVQTIRRWEETGELIPDFKNQRGVRFYDEAKILDLAKTLGVVNALHPGHDLTVQAELILRAVNEVQSATVKLLAELKKRSFEQ